MLHTVNHGLTGCQQQPSPDHAVWGDMCRPRAAAIVRQWLRLTMLVAFLACGLAFAGSNFRLTFSRWAGIRP